MKKQYVYTITYNGEIMYVGKTSNMKNRKSLHRNQRGTHNSAIPVDADLSKIEFNVVAEFNDEAEALKYEDELMLQYNTIDNGWNKRRSGLVCSDKEYVLAQSRDYSITYYHTHKEERAAYDRDYKSAHKEEKAAYDREYYQAHKKEKAAYMRDYRARKKAEGVRKVS